MRDMPIVGITITKLEAEKKEVELKGEMNLTSTHRIVDIREEDNPVLTKKILAIDFTLSTAYTPAAGTISLSGQILYLASEADKKEILKEWKSKKLPDAFGVEIVTAIYRKGLLLAAYIAQELQLPPPVVIPLPSAQKSNKSSNN